jgi:hypothetical protein
MILEGAYKRAIALTRKRIFIEFAHGIEQGHAGYGNVDIS